MQINPVLSSKVVKINMDHDSFIEETMLEFLEAKQKILEFMFECDQKEIEMQNKAKLENTIIVDELMQLQEFNLNTISKAMGSTLRWIIDKLREYKNLVLQAYANFSKKVLYNITDLKIDYMNTRIIWYANYELFCKVYDAMFYYIDGFKTVNAINNDTKLDSIKLALKSQLKSFNTNNENVVEEFKDLVKRSLIKREFRAKDINFFSSVENIKAFNDVIEKEINLYSGLCDNLIEEYKKASEYYDSSTRTDLANNEIDKYLLKQINDGTILIGLIKDMFFDLRATYANIVKSLSLGNKGYVESEYELDDEYKNIMNELSYGY